MTEPFDTVVSCVISTGSQSVKPPATNTGGWTASFSKIMVVETMMAVNKANPNQDAVEQSKGSLSQDAGLWELARLRDSGAYVSGNSLAANM